MSRAVLDSNVLVSAFIAPAGAPGQIFTAWQKNHFQLIISEYIISEVTRILETKLKLDRDFILSRIYEFYNLADLVEPTAVYHPGLEESDWPILGTAVAGQAWFLVTGDQALLRLKEFADVLIITPREFLAYLI